MSIEGIKSQNIQQNVSQNNQQQNVRRATGSETKTNAADGFDAQNNQGKNGVNTESQFKEINEKKLKSVIEDTNKKLTNTRTRCEFSVHEETNRISIKVIDKDTDEVIKEIPPEKSLEMIEKVWEIAGLLVDERR